MIASVLIGLLPALALVASLVAGRYPGERSLTRIRERLSGNHRRRRGTDCATPPPAGHVRRIHGGLLLASSLAGRAPPAPS